MKKLILLSFLLGLSLISRSQTINCSAMCVLNISNLDTASNEVDVTIYNGDTNHVNYPTVVLVNSMGDTIGNIGNDFYLFAHMPGDTIAHTIPYTPDTLPTTCTVYFTDQVWDTTCMFTYPMTCGPTGIAPASAPAPVSVYPNPAGDHVEISMPGNEDADISLYDVAGNLLRNYRTKNSSLIVKREGLAAGLYFILISGGEKRVLKKVIFE